MTGLKSEDASLKDLGLGNVANAFWNLPPAQLVEESLILGMGELASSKQLTPENLLVDHPRIFSLWRMI